MRRVLFLGQKQFGEAAWARLRQGEGDGFRVAAVCSNRAAEKFWWQSNRIFETRGSVPFIDNEERNEEALLESIGRYEVDTILCVQHPWVLTQKVLQAVGYRALNFHNAKLPDYRGYNAINHAILNGDAQFTCTAHWMADEVDKGDIAFEATFDIERTETALSLYAKCHHAGLQLFERVISSLGAIEELPRFPLSGRGRFYSRRSIDTLREIKFSTAEESEIKSRAFFFPPFEPAYFSARGRRLYVLPEQLRELGFRAHSVEGLHEMIEAVSCQVTLV
jgi:methionyl-tRNA formyltransferase